MRDKKKIILNIFMFLFYFIYQLIVIAFINILKIKIDSNLEKGIYLFTSSLIYFIIVLLVYRKELIIDLKNFNIKILLKYIPIYIIGIVLMGISSYIVSSITNIPTAENETLVREYIKLFPVYMTFSTVIYAPFVEEITFRKTFKNIINDKILFIIVSGIIFGLIHIGISDNTTNDLLMIIPYIIMGIDFSYIYCKSDNIFTTITIHSIHNLILLIIQFIGG